MRAMRRMSEGKLFGFSFTLSMVPSLLNALSLLSSLPLGETQARPGLIYCADLEINDDILGTNLKLPEGGIYPARYNLENGKLAEEYYDELPEDTKDEQWAIECLEKTVIEKQPSGTYKARTKW